MKYKSVFDIIGPVMIGPSSSHTAGAVRIGRIARRIFGTEPESVEVHFFGSFAETYQGHATDVAVIGGLLDFETSDIKIRNSIVIAKEKGIQVSFHKEEAIPTHPNTITLVLGKAHHTLHITGISIGGGIVQITKLDDFELHLSGESPTLLVVHHDACGAIADVSAILAKYQVNIGHMEVSRRAKGEDALMVIEIDQALKAECIKEISEQPKFIKVIALT